MGRLQKVGRGLVVRYLSLLCFTIGTIAQSAEKFDVVIYGATSAGLAAGIQAKRLGKSVVVLEPSDRIGGMTTGGLGESVDNPQMVGGIAREFYDRIERHYQAPEAWIRQERVDYQYRYEARTGNDAYQIWAFEPEAALQVLKSFVEQEGLDVRTNQQIVLKTGASKTENRIDELSTVAGQKFQGRMFIDASYEGDLLAAAGVSHELMPTKTETEQKYQPFSYRLCITDDPGNRVAFEKPSNYDEGQFLALLPEGTGSMWHNVHAPNNKIYISRLICQFQFDFISDYALAGYEERTQITRRIKQFQQGMMWTLANHPSVSERVRRHVGKFGLCQDEFEANQGWSSLYLRNLRRINGVSTMTYDHTLLKDTVEDSVSLGFEGDVSFPISFGSMLPLKQEVTNLVVPVCLSATAVAHQSISKEATYFSLGQAAGMAASLAIDESSAIQDVDYRKLRTQLESGNQMLDFAPFTNIQSIDGIVVDDSQAELVGVWVEGQSPVGIHQGYRHDDADYSGDKKAVYKATLPAAGEYEVQISYPPLPTRAEKVPVEVKHAKGSQLVKVNQKQQPEIDRLFTSLGRFQFDKMGCVTISNRATEGSVVIDAVRWLPVRQ